MGQSVSTFPVRSADFPIFSITFRGYDTVTVVDAPKDVIELVRNVFSRTYDDLSRPAGPYRSDAATLHCFEAALPIAFLGPRLFDQPSASASVRRDGFVCLDGVRSEKGSESGNCIHFQLKGSPFSPSGYRDSGVSAKKVCCALLGELRSRGWELALSSDLARLSDHSTLFFQRSPALSPSCKILCLSLSGLDKLQLINASHEAHRVLLECVGDLYQRDSTGLHCYEIVMKGHLWQPEASKESRYKARALLLRCFQKFHNLRYRYYGTANINGTADCIFFISDEEDVGQREYCVLSLNSGDGIRLIGAPREVVEVVGECIQNVWTHGIQGTSSRFADSFEYKLRGHPWNCSGADAVDSRRLISRILEELCKIGWAVLSALDVSRRPNDTAMFILRRCVAAQIPHFVICPCDADRIRIINANKEITELVAESVRRSWTLGIQKEGDNHGSYEMKLSGYPWSATSWSWPSQFELSRLMMARLLFELALHGWRVICSADVSSKYVSDSDGGPTYSVDVHSWFVAYTAHSEPTRPASCLPIAPDSLPTAPSAIRLSVSQTDLTTEVQRTSQSDRNFLSPPPSYAESVAPPSYDLAVARYHF